MRRGGGHGWRGLFLAGLALVVAVGVTVPAEAILHQPGITVAMLIVLTLILIGAAADMLAVAAAAASIPALHSMAARRRPGAKVALALKRNADRVVSISGDIVGDVAGTVSGAAAAAWAVAMAQRHGWSPTLSAALAVAVVAALTVGAKGTLKGVALEYANLVLYAAGYIAYVAGGVVARGRR